MLPKSITTRLACSCLAASLAGGCESYPLHGSLSNTDLHARLTEHFFRGMSYDEVNAMLTGLRVSEKYRHTYGDTPSREMLARLFGPGGFWLERESQNVRFTDLTFAFDEQDALEGLWTSRGGARYLHGDLISISPSPVIGFLRGYPAPPPPPVSPPREEEVALRPR